MIARLICWLWHHDWQYVGNSRRCKRCDRFQRVRG
jgi:hypothetical protein